MIMRRLSLRLNHNDNSCSFRIFSCSSQTFDSSFFILSEIFTQQAMKELPLNELWMNLVKTACIMTHSKRLKIIHLLLRILEHIQSANDNCYPVGYVNIFALRPLRFLLYSLASYEDNDTDSIRALYELFFYAEKLCIKWNLMDEYTARLKDKDEFVYRLIDVAAKINLIKVAINLNNNDKQEDQHSVVNSNIDENDTTTTTTTTTTNNEITIINNETEKSNATAATAATANSELTEVVS